MYAGSLPFSFYQRPRKKGRPVFCVRFRLPDGQRTPGQSTGKTSRSAATAWALAELSRRQVEAARVERELLSGISLADFAGTAFFAFNGRWATDRRASGKRLSARQCHEKQRTFDIHVLPVLGALKLQAINRAAFKDFRNGLFSAGLSASTINRALDCLRAGLEAAEDEGRIPAVPRIERASGKRFERGIPTAEEVKRLFSIPWADPRAFYASLLAALTALRAGECLPLRRSSIIQDELPALRIARSYDSSVRMFGDTTKTGKIRVVAIPPFLCTRLQDLAALNPHGGEDPLIFWAEKSPDHPCDMKILQRGLYQAMAMIGIDESERRRRRLSFHSWRHWLNSALLEAHVPAEKVRAVTGHATTEMTAHYYHAQLANMGDVRAVQAEILQGVTP